jgi:hypothetical protein
MLKFFQYRLIGIITILAMTLNLPATFAEDLDALLPAATSIYFRWHPHAEYADIWKESHAYGGLVKSGLLPFIETMLTPDNVRGLLSASGLPEENLGEIDAIARGLLAHIAEHGLLIGGDIKLLAGELCFVLPNGAGTEIAGKIDSAVRAYAQANSLEIKEQSLMNRAVAVLKVDTFFVSWWNEGKHLIISINQLGPNKAVGRANGKSDGYSKSTRYSLFKKKRDYAVIEEVIIDVEPLLRLLPGAVKEIPATIDMLGAKGLKGIALTTGLEGKMMRSDWDLLMATERTGLLSILGGPALAIEKLPTLPEDSDFSYATTINWMKIYDEFLAAVTKMAEIYPDMGLDTAPAMVEAFEETLGYKFRDEIFASLGDEVVLYSSPTDGPLFTGVSLAISIKDRDLISGAIDRLVDLVGLMDSKFMLEKTERDGVTYWIMGYQGSAMPMAPSIALGKNWLVATAVSPAAATRFFEIQAESGASPSRWASIDTKGTTGTITGLIQHDPRRAIEFVASFLPMVAATVRNLSTDIKIDLTKAPRADIIVANVKPSFAITSFDNDGIHCVSRYSLPLTNPEFVTPIYATLIGSLFAVGIAPPDATPFIEDFGLENEEQGELMEEADQQREGEDDAEGEEPAPDDMTQSDRSLRPRLTHRQVTYWR